MICTGSADQTLRFWNPVTGKELELIVYNDVIVDLAFSPDGNTLFVGLEKGQVKILNAADKTEIASFDTHETNLTRFALSSDGQQLATCSKDLTVKLWNVNTRELIRTYQGHTGFIYSVEFSPDNKLLASTAFKESIVWDKETGAILHNLKGSDGQLVSAFSRDGALLATGGFDQTTRLWDLSTGEQVQVLTGHAGYVFGLSFSSDGQRLATCSYDATVKVWDLSTGEIVRDLVGHNGVIISVNFSDDGKWIASTSQDKTTRVWEVNPNIAGKVVRGHTNRVHSINFSSDGNYFTTSSTDGTAKVWKAGSGELYRSFKADRSWVTSAEFSEDGKYLVAGMVTKTAKIWDIESEELALELEGHSQVVWDVDFSSDGSKVATASFDSTAIIWKFPEGEELYTLTGHEDWVQNIAFSPNNELIATASKDKTIILWDASNGERIHILSGHTGPVERLTFSPDGKYLATGSQDFKAKLWDVATGKEIRSFIGHENMVYGVAFSPDGKYLGTTSFDETVKLWEVETGRELQSYEGHNLRVYDCDFSRDGEYLATVSMDTTIRYWETKAEAFLSPANYAIQPGRIEPDKLLNLEIPQLFSTTPFVQEQLLTRPDPILLKSLSLAFQFKATDLLDLEMINTDFGNALKCTEALKDSLPEPIYKHYLATLNANWASKFLNLGEFAPAKKKIDVAAGLLPENPGIVKMQALINLTEAEFGVAGSALLDLHLQEKIDLLEEIGEWKGYPSFFDNQTWQGNAEKLIRILDESAADGLSEELRKKYSLNSLQFNDQSKEEIIKEIQDEAIRSKLVE